MSLQIVLRIVLEPQTKPFVNYICGSVGRGQEDLTDALWGEIVPSFSTAALRLKGGRPLVENREALIGILFVPYTAFFGSDCPLR